MFAIADAIMGLEIKNATYRNHAEVSENVASRDLKILVDKRVLVPLGDKRGRQYGPSGKLKEARDRAFTPFSIPDETKAQLPAQSKLPGF